MSTDEDRNAQPQNESEGNSRNPRRNFLKAALAFAVVLVVAGVAAITRSLSSPAPSQPSQSASSSSPFPRLKVTSISALELNRPITFNYPLDDEPNILVKLGQKAEGGVGPDGDIVALSQICQHLGCIYGFQAPGSSPNCNTSYKAPSPMGYCCCHGSIFGFVNAGKVLGGPSPRPVPQVTLEVDSTGDIYAVGMKPPTIFGHSTGSDDVVYDLQGGTPVS